LVPFDTGISNHEATDIMKITGHASGEMLRAYDKSERADNPTKKVNLVG